MKKIATALGALALAGTLGLGAGCGGSSPAAPTKTDENPIEIPVTYPAYNGPFFAVDSVTPGKNTTVVVGQDVEVRGRAFIPQSYVNDKEGWIDVGVVFVRDDGSDGRCLVDTGMGSSGYYEADKPSFVMTRETGASLTNRLLSSDIVCGGEEGCKKLLSGHELNAVMYMTKPGKSYHLDTGYTFDPRVGWECKIAYDNMLQHEFVKLGIKVK